MTLSIIVTSYKESVNDVMETLMSIDRQKGVNFDDIEVILVNDAGTPISEKSLKSLSNITPVYVINEENLGPMPTRKKAFDMAKNEYVTFIDAQDVYVYDFALNLIFNQLRSTTAPDHQPIQLVLASRIREELNEAKEAKTKFNYIIDSGWLCNLHAKVFHKEFLKSSCVYWLEGKELAAEDEHFVRQVYDYCNYQLVREIKEPIYLYAYGASSLTHAGVKHEFYARIYKDYLRIMSNYLDIVRLRTPWNLEKVVTHFCVKSYLHILSDYFDRFPEHKQNAMMAFVDFYHKYGKWETKDIRFRHELMSALAVEVRRYPAISYDRFIDDIKRQIAEKYPDTKTTIPKYKLALCLITKDENYILGEWLDHHINQGVEHFYIYDNLSSEPVREFIKSLPYDVQSKVTIIEWTTAKIAPQQEAYNDCLQRFGKDTKWLGFVDTDEHLHCLTGVSLPEFLDEYEYGAGLFVSQMIMSANGQEKMTPGLLVDRFPNRITHDHDLNYVGKIIVQPRKVDCMHIHNCLPEPDEFVLQENHCRMPMSQHWVGTPSIDKIVIKHYFTKSYEEWLNKIQRGRVQAEHYQNYTKFFDINPDMIHLLEDKEHLSQTLNTELK